MCGILFYLHKCHEQNITYNFKEGLDTLIPRGPDMNFIIEENNMKFGFTRLAINGLTTDGMQPFCSNNCILICNGEIYNYKELAKEYDINLTTGSDCEIIIPLYKKIGMELCNKLDGVFAFVLYDKVNNLIYAVRDPYGVRPLFLGNDNQNNMYISSELKAISKICENVQQFLCGNYLEIHSNIYTQYINKLWEKIDEPMNTIYEKVRIGLSNAVHKRMMADVEIGCLLSGGVDSSLICGLVAKQHTDPSHLKTFSIGLAGSPDLIYAKQVATFLGTTHFEIILTEKDILDAIPEVIYAIESYDVTTIRASIGNYLLGKYIKYNTNCKVIFNGDGADEIFGSYKWLSKIIDQSEFEIENNILLNNIHFYDVLRSDRSMASNGLEARTPFLDKNFVKTIMSISSQYKMHNTNIEKHILRKAFSYDYIIPSEILWRSKTAFSDGVTDSNRSLFNIIGEHIDNIITDHQYLLYKTYYKCISKEHYYYIKTFKSIFGKQLNIIPHLWLPPMKYLGECIDPSARLL
jgi:asparagine synthase (glutamine-hydrolysing)